MRIPYRWLVSFVGFPLGGMGRFTVFGAVGAITVAALTTVLPIALTHTTTGRNAS